ncbi:cysteine--tRNA ligase [Campylobacter sp. faydin G-140]|uniref:cysteine--tRNA ligase n=1 Tax=Campylobacter anatolicus TaxID=2829105 RepID=UPI001B92741D|nr:cysteine--tRNA ligase [Campylobacter anatolicus]MBR8465854.1 cysteine--tRNA ligase [Campylobacter anatolicus]
MQIYDSVKKQKLTFEPIVPGQVSIYLCGPTVYDDAHLGHAKSAISFDMFRRVFVELGYKVKFVRNYTDIDDKILKKMEETGKTLIEITQQYIESYERDMSALNVLDPDIKPKATECIDAIIEYILSLKKQGVVYDTNDGIYFDTSKDSKYLSLSGKSQSDENIARVQSSDEKRNEKDFVLWKFDKKWYDSPFGKGRPGWHTECVAMIKKHFLNSDKFKIDIHAGGIDLLFPHHENEAAQCRCAEGKMLAKYWLHNGFIKVNNEKMSKSLGNSFFIKDALNSVQGEVLRFYLLSSHYRAHFNYSDEDLAVAKRRLDKFYRLKKRLLDVKESIADNKFKNELLEALSDDLNTSKALAVLDEFIKNANESLDANAKDKALKQSIVAGLNLASRLFGVGEYDSFEYFQFGVDEVQKTKIQALLDERSEAKKQKNFAKADQIRTTLNTQGIEIMDTPNGTMWEKL